MDKVREGLQDYLNAIGDEGEPEVMQDVVVIFEARGMNERGQFARRNFLIPQMTTTAAAFGTFTLISERVNAWFRGIA